MLLSLNVSFENQLNSSFLFSSFWILISSTMCAFLEIWQTWSRYWRKQNTVGFVRMKSWKYFVTIRGLNWLQSHPFSLQVFICFLCNSCLIIWQISFFVTFKSKVVDKYVTWTVMQCSGSVSTVSLY